MQKNAPIFAALLALLALAVLFSGCLSPTTPGGDSNQSPPQDDNGTVQPQEETAVLVVDASSDLGGFNDYLFGTLSNPSSTARGYELLRGANFRLAEVLVKVPVPADPELDSSYDFGSLDSQMENVIGAGAEPMVWFNPDNKPANLEDYSVYVKKVAARAAELYGARIFRFGNEPDNAAYWKGTQEEFFETFEAFSDSVKSVDKDLLVDSPGVMVPVVDGKVSEWITNFLEYCEENDVKVDYVSFHTYSPAPYSFYANAMAVKAEADKYQISDIYGTPKIGNDEWNLLVGDMWGKKIYHSQFDGAWVASSNILSLMSMMEAGTELSIRYGGTSNSKAECHDFPLTDCDEKGKPAYYAFSAFNQLAGAYRLDSGGGDKMNLGIISGRKGDEIIAVISNYDVKAYVDAYETDKTRPSYKEYERFVSEFGEPKVHEGYELQIDNIPYAEGLVYEKYVIDDGGMRLDKKDSLAYSEKVIISESMESPSVQLVLIYPTGASQTSEAIQSVMDLAGESAGNEDAEIPDTGETKEPSCGDGTCGPAENPVLCPEDCEATSDGTGGGTCGDGICGSVERTKGLCPEDCS